MCHGLNGLVDGALDDERVRTTAVAAIRDYGPGYRVYYKRQGRAIVVLLAGGDKRTQDIETALRLAKNL